MFTTYEKIKRSYSKICEVFMNTKLIYHIFVSQLKSVSGNHLWVKNLIEKESEFEKNAKLFKIK